MLATNFSNIRNNLKNFCDQATDNNETIVITRKNDKNVVLISLEKFNQMEKAAKNAEYLAMIDESMAQLERGETISFSMEELRAMESEDWEPTQKVLDFEKAHNIKRRQEQ